MNLTIKTTVNSLKRKLSNYHVVEAKITIEQLKEIRKLEGEIITHKETIAESQKIIDDDWEKLTKIFDEIYKTAKIDDWE